MTLDSLLARARYLVLALPLFALTSTVHAGCNLGPGGSYYQGRANNTGPSIAAPDMTGPCVVYRNGDDGYGGGYYVPCDDDEGYGGYGGYDGDGGAHGHGP
jgi:hypothetical protein